MTRRGPPLDSATLILSLSPQRAAALIDALEDLQLALWEAYGDQLPDTPCWYEEPNEPVDAADDGSDASTAMNDVDEPF